MSGYELRAFGGLSLSRNREPAADLNTHRKTLTLLAVLAASPDGMPRERVMSLFWPESDAEHARGSLKQMLHAIRNQLGDRAVITGISQLGVEPKKLSSDVAVFRELVSARDDDAAIALYTGPFLDGVHVDGAGELERWISETRDNLSQLYAEALERKALASAADSDNAVRVWRKLVATDPLSGRLAIGLMRAMELSGDRAGALRHARSYEARLKSELGAGPDTAVVAFIDTLRSRNTPAGSTPATSARDSGSDADALVNLGLQAQRRVSPGGGLAASRLNLDEARAWFTRALTIDPQNARARCGMGNCFYLSGILGFQPREEAFSKGREMIFTALAADDRCAEVHCSLGKIALYFDDDFPAAARYIKRSLELEPDDAEALRIISVVYKILGRGDDAIDAAREAAERSPDTPVGWNALADALLSAGRNSDALAPLKRAIALRSGYVPALERLELAKTRMGDYDSALEIRKSRLGVEGNRKRAGLLIEDGKSVGAMEAIRLDIQRELDELLMESETVDPFEQYYTTRSAADRIVTAYATLEQWDKAMDWIENAYEHRPGRLRRMLTDSPFDRRGLAANARYVALMRVAGTEDLL